MNMRRIMRPLNGNVGMYLRLYQPLISSLFSMVLVTLLAAQMLERVRRLRTEGYKGVRKTFLAIQRKMDVSRQVELNRLNALYSQYDRYIRWRRQSPMTVILRWLRRRETGTRVTTFDVCLEYPQGLLSAQRSRNAYPRYLCKGFYLNYAPTGHKHVTLDGIIDPVLQAYDRKCERMSRARMLRERTALTRV